MYKLYRERREIHVPVREHVVFLTASEMIEVFFHLYQIQLCPSEHQVRVWEECLNIVSL